MAESGHETGVTQMDEPRLTGRPLRLLNRITGALSGSSERGALARGAATALVLQGMGAALAFAMQVLLGRWMGAAGYGDYSFTVGWANLIAIATGLGFPATVLRFVPAFVSHGDWPRLRGIVRVSLLFTIAAGVAVAALATVAFVFVLDLHKGSQDWLLVLGIWLAPLFALRTLQQETVRGFRRMVLAYAPTFVLRPLLVIIGCGLFVYLGGSLTSVAALFVTVIAFLVLVFGQEAVFWRGLNPELRSAEPHYETRAWLKVAMPLLLIASFAVILTEAGIVMVGLFEGAKEAGIYAAAQKTSLVVGLILLSMNAIAAPMIASLYAQGRHKDLDELVGRVARWTFWPTLAISVVLAAAAKPVLSLFGSQFASASWILIVLLSGQLISAAAGSVGFLMTQTGHQREAARVYGYVAILHVVLNVVGILLFGTIGAACATTITLIVWNVWLHQVVVHRLGIHSSILSRWLVRA